MAINTQNIRIDLNPGRSIPVAFMHQNDTNRQLTFELYNNGVAYTPASGSTVKFAYKSPIVNGQYSVITGSQMASGTVSGNTVTVTLPAQYTQVSGVGLLTMILTTSGNTLRPVNIKFVCQGSADGDDTVLGASDWPDGLYDYMDNWLEENEPTEIANLKSDINNIGNAVGLTVREATNLLGVHGNFENFALSSTNWYKAYNESTATVTDNVLSFDANRQFGSIRHLFSATFGHKYYFFATIKTTSPSVTVSINVDSPLVSCPNDGYYHFVSGIFNNTQTSSNKPFCIVNSSLVETQSTVYAQKCGVIDLTETFGSGNEPTKAQLDDAMHLIGDFLVNGTLIIEGTEEEEQLHAYEGKKILFMGDSITAANLNNNGWCKYFNEIMNPSKSVNVAVSGATWSDNDDTVYDGNPVTSYQANNTICNQVEKIARGKDTSNPNYSHVADYDDFDIIIISAGTNDDYSKFNEENIKPSIVELTWYTPLPYTSIDTKNAVGAMVYAYERLYTMYPNAKYFYCTPIQAYPSKKQWGDAQHKGDVMKETGDYIPPIIIDTEKCGLFGNQEQYNTEGVNLYDGLHPNANGARKIGEYNANAIIQTYLALDS